jgi:hypothetical protein
MEENVPQETSPNRPYIIAVGVLIVISIFVFAISMFLSQAQKKQSSTSPTSTSPVTAITTPDQNTTPKPSKAPELGVIALAGAERIYSIDLTREVAAYPMQQEKDLQKKMLDKIISDSIILQGGEELRLLKLSPEIFDSSTKNYTKRIQTVEAVKTAVEKAENRTRGSIISIWYFNNGITGPLGYEKSKELAFQKISALHADIIAGKMTMDQAADAIRNDSSLEQLDKVYQQNASIKFDVKPNEAITFDSEFNAVIRRLKAGQTSDVFSAKAAVPTKKGLQEVVYMVAKVDSINTTSPLVDFDSWYAGLQKKYAITYY